MPQIHLSVTTNPKQERPDLTAFLEWLCNSGHQVELHFTKEDLLDENEPVSLKNFPIDSYYFKLVDKVIFFCDSIPEDKKIVVDKDTRIVL